jgi:hypothetical protein
MLAIGNKFDQICYREVRYGSSTANSQMKTQLIGGNEYAENGDIIKRRT